jgi:hypothetical protein
MKIKKVGAFIVMVIASGAMLHAKKPDPGFSFSNKSEKMVLVGIDNLSENAGLVDKWQSTFQVETMEVRKKQSYDKIINLAEKTTVRLYDENEDLMYKAEFPAGKTIYIKWDGKKISPQKGDVFKNTKKGYSLKNNVKASDIKVIYS